MTILINIFKALMALFHTKPSVIVKPPVSEPPMPIPKPPHLSKIQPWALAIQHQEGGKPQDLNTRNHNPGNLKYTHYTATLGAKLGNNATDGGSFCYFDTYEEGFKALCQFLTDAASGKLIAYTPDESLDLFTETYAQPPNKNYVNGVATALGVPITTPIKELL